MNPISVTHIAKSFGDTKAVSDVSFDVKQGEVFGLLEPNSAGKTTTIRMMLDILKPDRGTVPILGGMMTNEKKERIGYMPEDRGLTYGTVPLWHLLFSAGILFVSSYLALRAAAALFHAHNL